MNKNILVEIENMRPTEFIKKHNRLVNVAVTLDSIADADMRRPGSTFDYAASCMTVAEAEAVRAKLNEEQVLIYGVSSYEKG